MFLNGCSLPSDFLVLIRAMGLANRLFLAGPAL